MAIEKWVQEPKHWIFDLDNTLYSENSGFFFQVVERMALYVGKVKSLESEEAKVVAEHLFKTYGTTLKGLMVENDVDPEEYSSFVHSVDTSSLTPNPHIRAFLKQCLGERIIFTNAVEHHAERVLKALNLLDLFEGIHDLKAMEFNPKPHEQAYKTLIDRFTLDPSRCIYFEDRWVNLQASASLGFTTVLFHHDMDLEAELETYTPHLVEKNIENMLSKIITEKPCK